jgi:hypothetical protein
MGAHVAAALALIGLAATCYFQSGSPQQTHGATLLLFAAFFAAAAVAVLLHAKDRGPVWLRSWLDDFIGPPPHRAEPEPDMKLIEALADACSCEITVDNDNMPVFASEEGQHIADALKEIRQQGRLGRLSIWGRQDAKVGSEELTLLSPILVAGIMAELH